VIPSSVIVLDFFFPPGDVGELDDKRFLSFDDSLAPGIAKLFASSGKSMLISRKLAAARPSKLTWLHTVCSSFGVGILFQKKG
jgi:hypothetical protein